MKKIILLLLLSCFGMTVTAQENDSVRKTKTVRKKFFNISYVSDKMKISNGSFNLGDAFDEVGGIVNDKNEGIKNNWGVSIMRGRSYMLHKRPIARVLSIGIDASFFDLNYSNFKAAPGLLGATMKDAEPAEAGSGQTEVGTGGTTDERLLVDTDFHKMEYSFQVGPSITITPGKKLAIAAYFRYAPTFSALYVDSSFCGNYASMFVTGASISYNKVGVGVEARMGSCKYKNFSGDLDFSANKIKTTGFRAYLQFRW